MNYEAEVMKGVLGFDGFYEQKENEHYLPFSI
jgi:hypothetical protein